MCTSAREHVCWAYSNVSQSLFQELFWIAGRVRLGVHNPCHCHCQRVGGDVPKHGHASRVRSIEEEQCIFRILPAASTDKGVALPSPLCCQGRLAECRQHVHCAAVCRCGDKLSWRQACRFVAVGTCKPPRHYERDAISQHSFCFVVNLPSRYGCWRRKRRRPLQPSHVRACDIPWCLKHGDFNSGISID